jgi:predicted pyridoxine 5'-phosphate oxidase superfamily flavin-nucleotide-binding protein
MERARLIIASADHFFIATCYDAVAERACRGADVSHRGGRPGFVHIEDERTLTFPDFPGNNHFNTLGNLAMDPRAGLLFIDFDTGDLLHLTGRAEVLWQGDLLAQYPRAERLVQFRVEQCRLLPAAMPWRWSFGEYSPAIDAVAQE